MVEFARPKNHPVSQSRNSSPAAAWMQERNGIPGVRASFASNNGPQKFARRPVNTPNAVRIVNAQRMDHAPARNNRAVAYSPFASDKFPKFLRPENHPDVQAGKYGPSVARWLYDMNGIPGVKRKIIHDPGKWRREYDAGGDGGTRKVYDLDFSQAHNSFYFGTI